LLTGLRLELTKIYRRPVSYLGFAALLLLATPVILEARFGGHGQRLGRGVREQAVVGGRVLTAQFCAAQIMTPAFYVFVPMLVALTAGGLVAGEASSGTLRTILVRPVPRWSLLGSKFSAGILHATLLCGGLGVICVVLGGLLLGFGDLVWTDEGIVVHPSAQALERLAIAYGLAAFSMWVMVSISLFFSVVFRSASAATASAVVLLIVCGIMSNLETFAAVKPYLFTSHLNVYRPAFQTDIPWGQVLGDVKVLAAYVVVGFVLSGLVFSRKDILC
jgi:ABC-2 type transport system permease protein